MCVVGFALLMERAGLSMALGTFLAGVLLADTEFRHELEADIEPFKGLLLGLFFMAVGMAVNVALVAERPLDTGRFHHVTIVNATMHETRRVIAAFRRFIAALWSIGKNEQVAKSGRPAI